MQDHLLQVRDLTVEYLTAGQPVRALEGISFSLARGDAVGILGESGCGKTTLLLSILGLLPPSARVLSGSILLEGQELVNLKERAFRCIRGAKIAFISQDPALALNPVIRVGNQIADVLRAHRSWSREECRAEAKRLLLEVGLGNTEQIYCAYPHQLSGGQRQRIAIAQAIACGPALVLADEPTTSLDTITQASILALLRRLQQQQQMSLFIVSHDPGVLGEVANRIIVLREGQIVADGNATDVLTPPVVPVDFSPDHAPQQVAG